MKNWKEWKSDNDDEILVTVDKEEASSGSAFDNAIEIIRHYESHGYEVVQSGIHDYYSFKKVKNGAEEPTITEIKAKDLKPGEEFSMNIEELEKVEKDLGISFDILSKILSNGVWVKKKDGKIAHMTDKIAIWRSGKNNSRSKPRFWLSYREGVYETSWIFHDWYERDLYFEDYGKTWALTKKELLKK